MKIIKTSFMEYFGISNFVLAIISYLIDYPLMIDTAFFICLVISSALTISVLYIKYKGEIRQAIKIFKK